MKQRGVIIDMRPVSTLDDANAPQTYVPVRGHEPTGGLAEMNPVELAERQRAITPTQENLTGDYKSRAIGFSIKTWQIALIVGVAMWLFSRVGAGVPLFSIRAMLWLLAGAGVVWMAAFALDLFLSPAGVAWYNSRRFWNHLDREQKERFDYWRKQRQD